MNGVILSHPHLLVSHLFILPMSQQDSLFFVAIMQSVQIVHTLGRKYPSMKLEDIS